MCVNHVGQFNLDEVIDGNSNSIIGLLYAIQQYYRYLPEPVLRELSEKIDKPLIEIYRLATFYKLFSLTPRGRHQVTVCTGTACHVRGSNEIVNEISRKLCVCSGETSDDGEVSLNTVNCLGACALGPLVEIDGKYHGNISKEDLGTILEKVKKGEY